jgi:hypothetical protein
MEFSDIAQLVYPPSKSNGYGQGRFPEVTTSPRKNVKKKSNYTRVK